MSLKRFIKEEILDGNDAWNCPRYKLETTVHFPIRRLDLTPYVPSNSGDRGSRSNSQQMGLFVYDLYAISIIMVD
ncbi:14598_t:CDS:2 [Gigaspora margarita]|uniref:14598_t:CDS:1 n=1 Tax=Gigaspora margarita TaxID=4874 RepID=A0ABN7URW7_GIGMA|nr:14598_t:CDS:2 [Gigaspora margarita]